MVYFVYAFMNGTVHTRHYKDDALEALISFRKIIENLPSVLAVAIIDDAFNDVHARSLATKQWLDEGVITTEGFK